MSLTGTFVGVGVDPTVTSVSAPSPTIVVVSYSESMDTGASEFTDPSSYALTPNGGSVARSVLSVTVLSSSQVRLDLDGPLSPGTASYTLVVSDVRDLAHNVIGANSTDLDGPPDAATIASEIQFQAALGSYDGDVSFVASTVGTGTGTDLEPEDLLFSVPDIPAPLSVNRVEISARAKAAAGSANAPKLLFLFRCGAEPEAQRVGDAFTLTDDWLEYRLQLHVNPFTGDPWSPVTISNIQFGVANAGPAGSTRALCVSELFLDLVVSRG